MSSIDIDINSRNRIVSDINTNFFVEAGAGSGKTTMLVNRMVAMVESGIDISEISAITFTKAAAGEFYDRFQKALIERSNPDDEGAAEKKAGQLPEPNNVTRENCAKALKNIDLCFMGTIDSFCNMILSEHPTEAGIRSDSTLISDEEKAVILSKLYVRICNGDFGEELKELSKVFRAVQFDDKDTFCRCMSVLLGHRNAHFNFATKPKGDIDKDFEVIRKELIKTTRCLLEHKDEIAHYGCQPTKDAWKQITDINNVINSVWSRNYTRVMSTLKTMLDLRVTTSAMDVHGPSLSMFFSLSKQKKWYETKDGEIKTLSERMLEYQYDNSIVFLDKCVPVVAREMLDAGQLTYFDYLYYLREVLKKDAEGDGKLIQYIYKRHKYFLIDEFQDTDPIQAEIFFYLTSEEPKAKWSECVPRPGSLFIVGDPKQSIYRFRNADVDSFLKVKKLFEDGVGGVLYLTQNFRSKSTLCEAYNDAFKPLFQKDGTEESMFEEIPLPDPVSDEFQGKYFYSVGKASEDPESISEIISKLVNNDSLLIRGKEEEEAEDEDKKKPRPIRYSDIMVITNNKDQLAPIMKQFKADGIPVKVEGEVLFCDNRALKEIYRLYSAIADSDDKIAFYSALTGQTEVLSMEEILVYRACKGQVAIYSDFDTDTCDNNTAKKVANKIKDLKAVQEFSHNMSPAALMAYIMDYYQIFKVIEAEELETVYYALELMRSAERSGVVISLLDGKAYLEQLLSEDSDVERCLSLNAKENRVHLANLHKIKGLEAPIVILTHSAEKDPAPSMRIEYNDGSVEGFLFNHTKKVKKNNEKGDKPQYDYYTLLKTGQFDSKEYSYEAIAEIEENKRKVYVAATRARNVLIVCLNAHGTNRWRSLVPEEPRLIFSVLPLDPIPVKKEKDYVSAEDLYKQAKDTSALKNRKKDGIEKGSFDIKSPSKLSVSSKAESDDSGSKSYVKAPELMKFADVVGTMVHKYMEAVISSRNSINADEIVKEIISEYRTAEMVPFENKIKDALLEVAKKIAGGGYAQTNGLPQDILNTLLSADEVYCEVPFCYKEDTLDGIVIWDGVMDVVYRSGDDWHIVDYKTNAEGKGLDKAYKNQLDAYKKAFKEMTGNDADALIYHIDV